MPYLKLTLTDGTTIALPISQEQRDRLSNTTIAQVHVGDLAPSLPCLGEK